MQNSLWSVNCEEKASFIRSNNQIENDTKKMKKNIIRHFIPAKILQHTF